MALLFPMLVQPPLVFGQARETKVFFLENARKKLWCAFTNEQAWKAAVQETDSMRVGAMIFSNNELSHIELTEEDESGDWAVNDQYFIDDHSRIIRLARVINVIPEDTSILESYSIRNGNATQIQTTAKRLSTGKPARVLSSTLRPELPIETSLKAFPFSALLGTQKAKTIEKTCVDDGDSR